MFKNYQGYLNIDQILKEEYNYTFDGNLQSLYKQPFIEVEGNGVDALLWIAYHGEKYLFKPLKDADINMWGELLSQKFAEFFNIPTASYRAASFGNLKGVLTKSFLRSDETLVLGSEIFQEFIDTYPYIDNEQSEVPLPNELENLSEVEQRDAVFNILNIIENQKHPLLDDEKFKELYFIPDNFKDLSAFTQKRFVFNYLNNLEQVWAILTNIPSIKKEEVKEIVESLRTMLLFDLITLQADRHPNNWGIIFDGENNKPAPLYDNAKSFSLGYLNMQDRLNDFPNMYRFYHNRENDTTISDWLYTATPNFTLSEQNVYDTENRSKDPAPKVLNDFCKITDSNYLYEFSKKFSELTEEKIEDMITELEKKMDALWLMMYITI